MKFFVGLHHPQQARFFDRACLSIRVLKGRRKQIVCPEILVDSGAFTELNMHGSYRHDVRDYAAELWRLHDTKVVTIEAAVAQDYMCEPFILAKTGMTIADHQHLTIERYDTLHAEGLPFPIMPVLQGYAPEDYVDHIRQYGRHLGPGMWVGVGSVCKRNSEPEQIVEVLDAIHTARPDIRLHGFGVKITALRHPGVRRRLSSSDSMAWSFHARMHGKDRNGHTEAVIFADKVRELVRKDTREMEA